MFELIQQLRFMPYLRSTYPEHVLASKVKRKAKEDGME